MEHFMTSEEIAEILHVDPVTIRRLVNKNELSAYRIGADYRFAPSDLQNYLQRQRITAHAENETSASSLNPLDHLAQAMRKIIQQKPTMPRDFDRFDRFTERARRVLVLAQEEARRFQHNYIGTEHLLLGLLREEKGMASQVLRNLGIEIERVRQSVENIIGRGERIVAGEVGLTPRAKKVIELAVDEARQLKHHYLGTEHLLLGLIREGQGIGAGVLESFGLQLEQVRAETFRVLEAWKGGQEDTEELVIPPVPAEASALVVEGEPELICTFCGAHCPVYFRHCFNCGRALVSKDEELGDNK